MSERASGIRVLHVEDEPDFADVTAEFLEHEDDLLGVETASRASEALDRLAGEDFDCVVSDYDMPGMDGIEFLERVREDNPELPFVLFTGKGSEEVASDAISAGVTDYLQKQGGRDQYTILANRIENAVEQRRARINYREIFEKVPDGVTLHDPEDGAFLDTNDQFCEMLGYAREELLELDFDAIHVDEPPYTSERAAKLIRKTAHEGPQTFEWLDETKAGERLPVEVNLRTTVIDGDERILAVVRDISERKERERDLEWQNERLEDFASVVSHDLKNLLTAVDGRLALLEEECHSEHLQPARETIDRMARLVEKTLALARTGRVVGDTEPLDPARIAEECWRRIDPSDAGATLAVGDLPRIEADPDRLDGLFENLFRNALDHGGEDVAVRVGPLADGNGFFVADDGPGIPADEREDVFQTGYSLSSDGHGLGLSIVRQIIEAHGWGISATASRSGGARFEITGVDLVDDGS